MKFEDALNELKEYSPLIAKIIQKYDDPGAALSAQEAKILKDFLKTASPEIRKYFKGLLTKQKSDDDAEYELHSKLPSYPQRWKTFDTPGS